MHVGSSSSRRADHPLARPRTHTHRDQIASQSDKGVPHNMPSRETFEDACSRLAVKRDDHVVLYDTVGVFSAPRTAFTFKVCSFLPTRAVGERRRRGVALTPTTLGSQHFGHERVSVLDGGLPRWEAEGHPVDTVRPLNPNPHELELEGSGKQPQYRPILSELLYASRPRIESYFIADIEEQFTDYKVGAGEARDDVRQWEDMDANVAKGADEGAIVVDARPAGRCVPVFAQSGSVETSGD